MKISRMINTRSIILWLAVLFVPIVMQAQLRLTPYMDAGENNVSDGFYIKTAVLTEFQFDKINVYGGAQFNAKSMSTNAFSGIYIKASYGFSIKEFPMEVQALYLHNPFSDVVRETNWGLQINIERTHFNFKLGSNFRSYSITRQASKNYDITSNRNLHENWNLMYYVGYNLKPIEHGWNVGVSITNMDHFLINQETNPMITLQGKYAVSLPLTVFIETWYKGAGALNISANYFGIFLRTGLIWRLDF